MDRHTAPARADDDRHNTSPAEAMRMRAHVPSPPAISLTNLFTVALGSATSSAVRTRVRAKACSAPHTKKTRHDSCQNTPRSATVSLFPKVRTASAKIMRRGAALCRGGIRERVALMAGTRPLPNVPGPPPLPPTSSMVPRQTPRLSCTTADRNGRCAHTKTRGGSERLGGQHVWRGDRGATNTKLSLSFGSTKSERPPVELGSGLLFAIFQSKANYTGTGTHFM